MVVVLRKNLFTGGYDEIDVAPSMASSFIQINTAEAVVYPASQSPAYQPGNQLGGVIAAISGATIAATSSNLISPGVAATGPNMITSEPALPYLFGLPTESYSTTGGFLPAGLGIGGTTPYFNPEAAAGGLNPFNPNLNPVPALPIYEPDTKKITDPVINYVGDTITNLGDTIFGGFGDLFAGIGGIFQGIGNIATLGLIVVGLYFGSKILNR